MTKTFETPIFTREERKEIMNQPKDYPNLSYLIRYQNWYNFNKEKL